MTFPQLWEFVMAAGVPGMGALFILALYRGKIRWGHDYDKLEAENEKLREEKERLLSSALKNAGISAILLEARQPKAVAE